MDSLLKYERIDKYRVIFIDQKDLKKLIRFCENHDIAVWFGADKLCIGFSYRGCQRLSAYYSTPGRESMPEIRLEELCHN